MNATLDRKLISQIVIIVAICIGGWMMLVEPQIRELNKLEAKIAEASENPGLLDHGAIERMADQLQEARSRLRGIERQNNLGRESSKMYGLIMNLAAERGVRMQRLDPGSDRKKTEDDGPVRTTIFDMTLEGSYQQVASFLDAVDEIEGFVRPLRLHLTPRVDGNRTIVEARFACEALTFTMPEELLTLLGGPDADG